MFENAEIIYSYTRKQAIEDGMQWRVSGEYESMPREVGYKWPVYLTSGVVGLIERAINNKKHCNDFGGVLWDVLHMSRVMSRSVNDRLREFKVIITGAGRAKYHTLYIASGPVDIDDPAPCLTIMLPEEN